MKKRKQILLKNQRNKGEETQKKRKECMRKRKEILPKNQRNKDEETQKRGKKA